MCILHKKKKQKQKQKHKNNQQQNSPPEVCCLRPDTRLFSPPFLLLLIRRSCSPWQMLWAPFPVGSDAMQQPPQASMVAAGCAAGGALLCWDGSIGAALGAREWGTGIGHGNGAWEWECSPSSYHPRSLLPVPAVPELSPLSLAHQMSTSRWEQCFCCEQQ